MSGSRVRLAVAADLPALEGIEAAADRLLIDHLHAAEWEPMTSGAARSAVPGFLLVVAEAEDAPVGFAHVLEGDASAHLEQVSVLPEFGRRGHGRALVEKAKAEARRRGHRAITLRTFADVPWNAPFYATCGFTPSEPATPFQHRLAADEQWIGIVRWGRRIQMTAPLG